MTRALPRPTTGLRAALTGEVDALPGVVRDDPPR